MFWLFDTGAGAALLGSAILGIIVGTIIVAQTLYSSTKDHLKEFATLRAIGSSRGYILKVISSRRCSARSSASRLRPPLVSRSFMRPPMRLCRSS